MGKVYHGVLFIYCSWKFASLNDSSEPKRTCCMTGYLAKTSALYILIRPEFTFDQVGTPLMFQSWFECSANGPFFTLKMNLMQPRNM